MSGACEGPAPARKAGPAEYAAARKHLDDDSSCADDSSAPADADVLRQLGHQLLHDDEAEPLDRLRHAATRAAELVAGHRVDRTSAVTGLSFAAQAAGISQTQALAVIRRAFREAMP